MPKYSYKARSTKGSLVKGFIDADSIVTAKKKLSEQGLIPISVAASKGGIDIKMGGFFKKKVKPDEILLFTRQFSTLFKAGMGMENILHTLLLQTENPTMKEVLESIRNDVQQGASLAKAFTKQSHVFDDLYVNMVASGEEAGVLEEVLDQLSDVLEKDYSMRKGIKTAMLYPKIVIAALILACTCMLYLVIPKFESLYESLDAALPLPTQILLWASQILNDYFIFVAIGFGVLIYLYKRWYNTPKGKFAVDKFVFKPPIFGPLNLKVANARFANILSCLYRSGLPVTKALSITAETIGNEAFMRDVRVLQADVEKGHSISDSMRRLTYFSPLIVEATNIGEKSGSLDTMLSSIGGHYDSEIGYTLKNLSSMIEPLLLFVIFGVVLVFALAVFLPIWNMSDAMLG